MEDSHKKIRFSQNIAPSSNPDQVPMFSCKPNRPSSPTNNSSEQLIMMSSQQNSDNHHHHHHHEDLQITMMREHKDQYCSGRDRLRRHREEVAGRVMVPDRWGKEDLMKDWIEYSSFDKLLVPSGIRSAREALVMEARLRQATSSSTATSKRLRIESRC